jgi:hypothetical protein
MRFTLGCHNLLTYRGRQPGIETIGLCTCSLELVGDEHHLFSPARLHNMYASQLVHYSNKRVDLYNRLGGKTAWKGLQDL